MTFLEKIVHAFCEDGKKRETVARLYGKSGAPVIALMGGISASRHVCAVSDQKKTTNLRQPGWWDEVVGEGKWLDPKKFQLLSFDFLPGDDRETSPGAIADFARISAADQADILFEAMQAFGLTRFQAVIGASYGGMVGQQFAIAYPQKLEKLICLGATYRPHPLASAWRTIQRRIVLVAREPEEGLKLARALSMTSYRSAEEFSQRFIGGIEESANRDHIWSYLARHGEKFAQMMQPSRFLSLSQSIDRHIIDPQTIRAPTLLIGFSSDQICPPTDLIQFKKQLGEKGRLSIFPSRFGHDGFIKEGQQFGPGLRAFLEDMDAAEG